MRKNVLDKCPRCEGKGWDWSDYDPHKGRGCGEKEGCRSCGLTGQTYRPVTNDEWLQDLERRLKKLEGGDE